MKVLMVLTNIDQLGTTGKPTGFYLPEVAHPYHEFKKAGIDVVFASPKGGKSPVHPGSVVDYRDDEVCVDFLNNPAISTLLESTLDPSQVDPKEYQGVFYAGGHGPMWDVAFETKLAKIAAEVYGEQRGVLGAVCHGTCGLLPIEMDPPLLRDLKVTSFTNEEEESIFKDKTWEIVNFSLQSKLEEKGADFREGKPWECNVVSDRRVVTGQNPKSATKCAQVMIEELNSLV